MSGRHFASDAREWLESDGLGGFASGTVSRVRTRRYHALLLAAAHPPGARTALVHDGEAWIETDEGRWALSSHRYVPGVIHPDGATRIESFEPDPWPTWIYRLENGTRIQHEIFARHGLPLVAVTWRALARRPTPARLEVRPLISGRDFHALHHENPSFRFEAETWGSTITWRPYPSVPSILSLSNGAYAPAPDWYRSFLYEQERARGLDEVEDLASPGVLSWDLGSGEAIWLLAMETAETRDLFASENAGALLARLRNAERRRRRFPSRLHRAADDYVVRRGAGRTIIAGYPWFGDWGRDTFIALRGLCLATGNLNQARDILLEWSDAVSQGMLPNRFADDGEQPEYNSVDASLWYVIAIHDYLAARLDAGKPAAARERKRLQAAVESILDGYARGTRHGIRMDSDGLLAAGEPGVQLTWMDARVGDRVVTPRIGKPVEVQALWLNALRIGAAYSERWSETFERGRTSFRERFWNEEAAGLNDVIDVDHVPGRIDATCRPNQIFAVGGLPFALIEGDRARRLIATVERRLWTPLGLRSLAPGEPSYLPRCAGGPADRDAAYHQGTVWPWLAGPFIEAWMRVHGDTADARGEARATYLQGMIDHLDQAGIGHVSEIADGDPPHTPCGCPFQAWSLGELVRLELQVLRPDAADGSASANGRRAVVPR
jgi:predicted glycogen debranching enzyme